MTSNNLIITGPPRSGTTLACTILNQTPNVVVLNEPLERELFKGETEAVSRIKSLFRTSRETLLKDGMAVSRHRHGEMLDNLFDTSRSAGRKPVMSRGLMKFGKPLEPAFTLGAKHCEYFSHLLNNLVETFRCIVVVRNPLSILSSWSTIESSYSEGELRFAEFADAKFWRILGAEPDKIVRQVMILHWFFGKYAGVKGASVVKYEDIIATGGLCLQEAAGIRPGVPRELESKNASTRYTKSAMSAAAERMISSEGAIWDFYSKDEVREILAARCRDRN